MAYNGTGLGEQIRQTDEYGNQIPHTGATTGGHGTHAGATTGGYGTHTGATTGAYGTHTGEHEKKEHGLGGILHRSNSSSSSSSSEDDGQGGRRKKLKDRVKDKLPGGKKGHGETTTVTPTPGAQGAYGHEAAPGAQGAYGHEAEHPEKKGFMEKIKEKLPGHH